MASRDRILLASKSAADSLQLEPSILRGFYCAAKRLADKRRHFDPTLLHIQNHGAARGKVSFRRRRRGLSRLIAYGNRLADCRLHYWWGGGRRSRSRRPWRSRWLRCFVHFGSFQWFARMIGSVVGQVSITNFGLRQQQLMLGRKGHVVRYVQILEHLLRYTAKHWRRNLSPLMGANRRVENHRNYDLWAVQRCKACERGVVLRSRVRTRRRIDLLPSTRLSSSRIAVENRPARSAFKNDLLHHGAHLGCGVGRNHTSPFPRMECDRLHARLRRHSSSQNTWGDIDSIIRKR